MKSSPLWLSSLGKKTVKNHMTIAVVSLKFFKYLLEEEANNVILSLFP